VLTNKSDYNQLLGVSWRWHVWNAAKHRLSLFVVINRTR